MDIIKYLSNPYTILNNFIIFAICCLFFNKYKRYTLNFLNIVTVLIIGVVCGLLLRLIGRTKVQFLIKGMESGDYEVISNTYFIYSILGFIPTIIVIILLCLIVLPITQAGIGRNINAMVSNAAAKNRFLYFLFTITIYFCISNLTINFISQFASGYGDFSRTDTYTSQ